MSSLLSNTGVAPRARLLALAVACIPAILATWPGAARAGTATPPSAASSYGETVRFGGFDTARYASGAYTGALTPGEFVDPAGFTVETGDPTVADGTSIWVLDRTTAFSTSAPTQWRLQKLSDTGTVLGSTTFKTAAPSSTDYPNQIMSLAVDPSAGPTDPATGKPEGRVYALYVTENQSTSLMTAQELVAWSATPESASSAPGPSGGGLLVAGGDGQGSSTNVTAATGGSAPEMISTSTQLGVTPIYGPTGIALDDVSSSEHDIAIEGYTSTSSSASATVQQVATDSLSGSVSQGAERSLWHSSTDTMLLPGSGVSPVGGYSTGIVPEGISTTPGGDLLVLLHPGYGSWSANADFAISLNPNLSDAQVVYGDSNGRGNASTDVLEHDASAGGGEVGTVYAPGAMGSLSGYDIYASPEVVGLSDGAYAGVFGDQTSASTATGYAANGVWPFNDSWNGVSTSLENLGIRLSGLDSSGNLDVLGTLGNAATDADTTADPAKTDTGDPCQLHDPALSLAAGASGAVWGLARGTDSSQGSGGNPTTQDVDPTGGRWIVELAPGVSGTCPGVSGYFKMTDSGNSSNVSSVVAGASGPSITIPVGDSVKYDAQSISYGGATGFADGAPYEFEWDTNGPSGPGTDGYSVTNDWLTQPTGDSTYFPSPTATSTAFTSPGVYTVGLQIYGDYGVTNQTGTVIVQDSAKPTAAFTPPGSDVWAGKSLSFDASGSTPSSSLTSITLYTWSWGDGQSDQTSSATDTHKYAAAGSYTVKLTIGQSDDQSVSVSHTVVVTGAPSAALSGPATASTGQSVSFSAGASVAGSGSSISSYAWSFGDGSTDSTTTASDTHTYTKSGTYTATVTVTDADGQNSTAQVSVKVTVASPPGGTVGSLSASAKPSGSGATLTLVLGAAGHVNVAATAKIKVVELVKGKRRTVTKTVSVWHVSRSLSAGQTKLTLTPSAAVKAQLKKGALKVTIVITYTPSGGKAITKTLTVTLPKTKASKR